MTRPSLRRLADRALYPGRTPSTTPARRPAPTGLYLGMGSHGPVVAGPEDHVLVLGPPRSGKTTRLLIPSVLRHRGPVVLTSTKPDVLRSTIGTRRSLGRCWYWDPSGKTVPPQGTQDFGWSPVDGCGTWDEAVARAHALTGAARPEAASHEAHWIERAQALLAPLLNAAALGHTDMAALLSWLHRRELTIPRSILEEHDARRAVDVIEGLAHTDLREMSGIFSTADGVLGAYRTDAALQSTRRSTFDPSEFVASTDTLYLVAGSTTQHLHAPLVVALLEQIREAAYRWRPAPPLLFALDEVANIAPLPGLPSILAEGGSQGLVVLACLQDLSQARARWGKAADGFLTLFTHKLLLPGIADPATLKAIAMLAGQVDVPIVSTSTGSGLGRRSITKATRRQPRLPEDQVSALPPRTALLLNPNRLTRVRL